MAAKKRAKSKKRNPATRRVSRSKKPVKRKQTRGKSKPRSARKNGGKARAVPRRVGRSKKGSGNRRTIAPGVRQPRKRSARISPRFSDATRRPGETAEQHSRRLEQLLRTEREVTRELTRSPTERARNLRFVDVTGEEDEGGPDLPPGFQPVGTGTGTPIGDLNDLTGALDDIDWDDFDVDWDDIYNDVGEEDEDLYGEQT